MKGPGKQPRSVRCGVPTRIVALVETVLAGAAMVSSGAMTTSSPPNEMKSPPIGIVSDVMGAVSMGVMAIIGAVSAVMPAPAPPAPLSMAIVPPALNGIVSSLSTETAGPQSNQPQAPRQQLPHTEISALMQRTCATRVRDLNEVHRAAVRVFSFAALSRTPPAAWDSCKARVVRSCGSRAQHSQPRLAPRALKSWVSN